MRIVVSIVELSQMQSLGFGPIYPVAQIFPSGCIAMQWMSSVCPMKCFYVLDFWSMITPIPAQQYASLLSAV